MPVFFHTKIGATEMGFCVNSDNTMFTIKMSYFRSNKR